MLSWPQSHSVAGSIKSMNNSNDPIKNLTCNLMDCMQFLNQLSHHIKNIEIFSDIIWYFIFALNRDGRKKLLKEAEAHPRL